MTTHTEPAERGYAELQEVQEAEIAKLRRNARIAIAVAVVLAVALVGFGIWTFVGDDSTAEAGLTDEMQQLVDDYHAAWNDLDVETLGVLTTDGYIHVNYKGQFDKDEQSRQLTNLDEFGWHPMEGAPPPLLKSSGSMIVTGDDPWYVAALSDTEGIDDERARSGISLLTIVQDDGALRISRHVYAG